MRPETLRPARDAALPGATRHAGVALVYGAALLQGLVLVSYPAAGPLLKETVGLSDAQYGALFVPQVVLTAAGALFGGLLARRLGLRLLLALGLLAGGASQLALWLGVAAGSAGHPWLLAGTALLGLGFGLGAAPQNRYPALLFPRRADSALVALHTILGIGLTVGPLLAGWAMTGGAWALLPGVLAAVALPAAAACGFLPLPADGADAKPAAPSGEGPLAQRSFWALFAVAAVYAVAEGAFSNWAVIYLHEERAIAVPQAALALSVFWGALAGGRLLVSALLVRMPARPVWRLLPLLMALAFWLLPAVRGPLDGMAAYGLAGLACSAFFPLTVGIASAHYPRQAALVSSLMVSALMLGVGLGSYGLGPLRAAMPLARLFPWAAAVPLLALGLGLLTERRSGTPPVAAARPQTPGIPCPACRQPNPADAVFCANPACHKALGEFPYVLEELRAAQSSVERLAERVNRLAGHPHFATAHLLWFALWITLNSGLLLGARAFDRYPYDLLSFALALEATLLGAFLLISNNRQNIHAEKRAELDYEVNVRTYRAVLQLLEATERLQRRLDTLEGRKGVPSRSPLCH